MPPTTTTTVTFHSTLQTVLAMVAHMDHQHPDTNTYSMRCPCGEKRSGSSMSFRTLAHRVVDSWFGVDFIDGCRSPILSNWHVLCPCVYVWNKTQQNTTRINNEIDGFILLHTDKCCVRALWNEAIGLDICAQYRVQNDSPNGSDCITFYECFDGHAVFGRKHKMPVSESVPNCELAVAPFYS